VVAVLRLYGTLRPIQVATESVIGAPLFESLLLLRRIYVNLNVSVGYQCFFPNPRVSPQTNRSLAGQLLAVPSPFYCPYGAVSSEQPIREVGCQHQGSFVLEIVKLREHRLETLRILLLLRLRLRTVPPVRPLLESEQLGNHPPSELHIEP